MLTLTHARGSTQGPSNGVCNCLGVRACAHARARSLVHASPHPVTVIVARRSVACSSH